ncbi:MAG: putative neutral zinc metallopeptidase [Candidatus Hydrogenedentes bacterium ADurb.Bin101]|nr:zinc metallopeptidase [Candidatus Hydrogenedentota bacterium]OQC08664.1 MAG: putative neutral zinc metallopeptidase [Candidatus Hydrogenedentes bacterium ADurb.Bin101]HOC69468.1 neutral zinc metallopeptidase [Candidatus Hydrogenedentota bacterium]
MRWRDRRMSSNVEDRRGLPVKRGMVGGGMGMGVIVLILAVYMLGGDPKQVMEMLPMEQMQGGAQKYTPTAEEEELAQFASVVLAETEDVWTQLLPEVGGSYEYPKLVLFSGAVESACGYAGSATGPFYCPGDRKVYIDLSFFNELRERFQAPGDFAMAYVIAHEIGHHVQTLLGISEQVMSQRSRLSETAFNKQMVCMELQADFLAGVWAHYASRMNLLEEGDLEEAMNAASAVGDDRIQNATQGYVVPDSFTHGTSEQRKRWFKKGFTTGDPRQGDTFNAAVL